MSKRSAPAILTLILLFSLVLTSVAQSTPDWPDWVFTGHWPPGEYTVWTAPSLFYSDQQYTITVPEGYTEENPFGDFYTVSCMDAACTSLMIFYLVYGHGGAGEMPLNYTFVIRWEDWGSLPNTGTATPPPGTTTPTTTTPVPPTATPTPEPLDCPDPVIEQRLPPLVERIGIEPPNPVVVGQGGQGLVVRFRVTSFPVVRHWWEAKSEEETVCVHVETGFVDDGRYGVSPCAAGWPGWETRTVRREWCEEHIEIIPDPIRASGFMVHARLREQSKQWIRGELRTRYPGADIQHPDWDVPGVTTVNGCLGDGRCVLEKTARVLFEDPGYYDMWVDGFTVGTAYTPPRAYRYSWPQPQPVYLMDTTIIR